MAGRFKARLQQALEDFDIHAAETVVDDIYEAEQGGYEITDEEDRLWARLTRCIEMYRRSSASL
jgi:hypothetical protein